MGWVLFILLIAGIGLLTWGVRGRLVGDAAHCVACGFDLSGVPGRVYGQRPRAQCPECGVRIASPDQVRIGQRVRKRWAIAMGSLTLAMFALALIAMQTATVRNFRWIEHKPESWLLRDAIRAYEAEDSAPPREPYGETWEYADSNVVELLRRATNRSLSDETLVNAARTGIDFMQAWAPDDHQYPPIALDFSGGWASWAEIAAIALDRDLLTHDERVVFCTSTLAMAVRTPSCVVRGDPLPIEFLISVWSPNWYSLQQDAGVSIGDRWPTNCFPPIIDFVFEGAAIDGEPIRLIQFDERGVEQERYFPRGVFAIAAEFPAGAHPRADFAPGRHALRVRVRASVRVGESSIRGALGRFASFDDLGFPDEGWAVEMTREFEVVEQGPTRSTVPMDGPFLFEAVLEEPWSDKWGLEIRWPHTNPPPRRSPWMDKQHIFAARAAVRVGEVTTDVGPWILPYRANHGKSFLLPAELAAAIRAAPPGSAVLILTPDAEVAKLVTAPGPLIAFDPIELPIRMESMADSDASERP